MSGMWELVTVAIHHFRRSLGGRRSDEGASLVEYAFLVALIAIVCLVAVLFLGEETSESFASTADSIRNA